MSTDDFWPYKTEVQVPWRDLDAAGHVNNAVYFSYMESCRAEAWLRMRGGETVEHLDIILAHTSCDYRSPATFRETLEVTCWPTRVGQTSFALSYRITDKRTKRLVAEGKSIQLTFDYATQTKKPIPEDVRKQLEAGLAADRQV